MEYPKKELIKEITDLFEDYEESYVPGEWESFSSGKRKYPFFPTWFKVAAVLFLMVSALPFNLKDLVQTERSAFIPVIKGGSSKKNSAPERKVNPVKIAPAMQKEQMLAVLPAKQAPAKNNSVIQEHTEMKSGNNGHAALLASLNEGLNPMENKVAVVQAENKPLDGRSVHPRDSSLTKEKMNKLSTLEFLTAESRAGVSQSKKKEKGSKWDFGVLVMPTATGSRTNVGAGITTAYKLSDRFSLSSGLSMLQLGSDRNVPAPSSGAQASFSPPGFSAMSISDKELLSVNASIKAIDIPVGLVYKVNKHFFTSAGVSLFNVLSEKRSNTYAQTSQVNKMTINAQSGVVSSYRAIQTDQVAEPVSDAPLSGKSYLGFFNFSIGHQQPIFNHYNIQIEPFIKVPLGKLSAQDLRLMNSGVKFQLSF